MSVLAMKRLVLSIRGCVASVVVLLGCTDVQLSNPVPTTSGSDAGSGGSGSTSTTNASSGAGGATTSTTSNGGVGGATTSTTGSGGAGGAVTTSTSSTSTGTGGATTTTGSGGAGGATTTTSSGGGVDGGTGGAACSPESDATFCAALGLECGPAAGVDGCGQARSIASCGTCLAPGLCGGGGIPGSCWHPLNGAWEWQLPRLTGENLSSVWANNPSDVWAVGAFGTIVHWDGQSLSVVPSGTSAELSDIWGSAPGDLWAVGAGGTILHYDGTAWSQTASVTSDDLLQISGCGPSSIWAVGANANGREILSFDGSQWSVVLSQILVQAVGGAAPNDVWAVDWDYHYDGQGWFNAVVGVYPESFQSIHAISPSDVWVVGAAKYGMGPVVRRYDGTSWVLVPVTGISASDILVDVWATALGEAWAAGVQGTYHRAEGATSWTTHPFVAEGIHGSAPTNVWLAGGGGQLMRWDGTSLARMTEPIPGCTAIHGVPEGEVWTACGGALERWDGASWAQVVPPGLSSDEQLTALWAAGVGDLWIITSANRLLHLANGAWSAIVPHPGWSYYAISGTSNTDIWVFGSGGTLLHYDGTSWTTSTSTNGFVNACLWAAAPNDVWASRGDDYSLHYDGTAWSLVPFPSGIGGAVQFHGTSATNVWALTQYGVAHWDGSAWEVVAHKSELTGHSLVSMWVAGLNDVFVSDMYSNVMHFDGVSWTTLPKATVHGMSALWGIAPRDLFLVGHGILRYH